MIIAASLYEGLDVSVFLGNPVSLDCIAVGKPEAQISWILPDRTFVRDIGTLDRRVSLFPNGTLSIHSANFSNKGDYKCIASNAAGADTLTYHIRVAALPPIIVEVSHETIFMNAGRNIYVDCTAKGEPFPLIKWVLPDGSQMKPTQFIGSRIFIFPNGTLYIKNINPNDSGRYECSATNPVGFAKRTVIMVFPPQITHAPPSITRVNSGSPVILNCIAAGIPKPDISWTLPGQSGPRFNVSSEGWCLLTV
uniref:Ig-like domain-containing protein n=1 Tax=Sinocyclocheilus rhinocerous TaxID=307959 RepID=A0A673N6G0_9TELE